MPTQPGFRTRRSIIKVHDDGDDAAVLQDEREEKYSESDIKAMKDTAKLKAGDRNPYSWNMDFYEYEDGSGYEARFTSCGICRLMGELGLTSLIPAMCRLDYTMSEAGGVTILPGIHLASAAFCDCGYKKK